MNKLEQQEIESIRLELHDMFKNSPERPAIVFRITSRLWKLSHKKNSMRQMADEIKTSIEKIIAKHEDCICSSWAELRKEIFEAVDYHLTADAVEILTNEDESAEIERQIINDARC